MKIKKLDQMGDEIRITLRDVGKSIFTLNFNAENFTEFYVKKALEKVKEKLDYIRLNELEK